jgi:hypothetical protein
MDAMKRIIAARAAAAFAMVAFTGTASAAEHSAQGKGKAFQTCFGAANGQTGLQYGQLKKDAPHPVDGGYGLPGVLATHGPGGAIPAPRP